MVAGSPEEKPLFVDPERAQAAPYPGAAATGPLDGPDLDRPTFDDELVAEDPTAPSRGILNRYREVARLHSMGKRNCEIARMLGYTESRLSLILKDSFVQAEISRWRDRLVDDDAITRLKEAARDGATRIHSLILDPKTKESTALAASQFAVEMSHGKARQAVSVESGSLNAFTEMLHAMRSRGEALDVIEVFPTAVLPPGPASDSPHQVSSSSFDTWLDQHLPTPALTPA